MRAVLVCTILAVAVMPARPDGHSTTVCAPWSIIEATAEKLKRKPVSAGVANNGSVFVVFADEAGEWAAVIRDAQNRGCLVMEGDGYEPGALPVADGRRT